ncbi:MAG: hypothetical protein QMD46_04195 [Methanomicrobiales archaeon]|nr:hypothetical protein [Methanomicrobiales archaeon]MDI6876511.1 hypothetical protein [Methanomicrobiales archaeon]
MDLLETKTWVIFYLVSLATLLWAVFLTAQGSMLWISLTLVIVVVGVNGAIVCGEIRRHASRRRRMQSLFVPEPAERGDGHDR